MPSEIRWNEAAGSLTSMRTPTSPVTPPLSMPSESRGQAIGRSTVLRLMSIEEVLGARAAIDPLLANATGKRLEARDRDGELQGFAESA